MNKLCVFLCFTLLSGCQSSVQEPKQMMPTNYITGNTYTIDGPVKPDDIMKKISENPNGVFYVTPRQVLDWKLQDMSNIVKLVYSKKPAASVISTASSIDQPKMLKGSTIGQEARFIILGYMTLNYPPRLMSNDISKESENMAMIFAETLLESDLK